MSKLNIKRCRKLSKRLTLAHRSLSYDDHIELAIQLEAALAEIERLQSELHRVRYWDAGPEGEDNSVTVTPESKNDRSSL